MTPRHRQAEITDDQQSLGSILLRIVMILGMVGMVGGMIYLRTFPPTATVMSDSMEPKIAVGDIVVFKALRGAMPEIGDVVEVKVPQEYQDKFEYPGAIIHRVTAINEDGTIETKGDNLPSPDPFESKLSTIDRKVVFTIPLAGRAMGFLVSPFGLLWVVVGLLIFVVMPFYDVLKERAELHHIEVASLAELQAKVEEATSWAIGRDGTVAPYAPHAPPAAAGRSGLDGEADVVVADTDVTDRIEELVSVVGEYGYHLKSHTEILKAMSAASQDLARVVADLQRTMASPPEPPELVDARVLVELARNGGDDFSVANTMAFGGHLGIPDAEVEASLQRLAVARSIELQPLAAGTYAYRLC
jgi:signal peptidase